MNKKEVLFATLLLGMMIFVVGLSIQMTRFREAVRKEVKVIHMTMSSIQKDIDLLKECLHVQTVDVTAYPPLEKYTDSTPWITAFSTRVRPGVVAVSRDLIEKHNMTKGQPVKLLGYDEQSSLIFEDVMGEKARDSVDIWMPTEKECRQFGRRKMLMVIAKQ
jgi:3D (Asp-Asp-Asp) domain-containing protein